MTVTERGQTDSRSNVTLTSRVEGTSTIIFLVPEGTAAKAPIIAEVAGTVTEIVPPEAADDEIESTSSEEQTSSTGVTAVVVTDGNGAEVRHEVTVVEPTRLRVEVGDAVEVGEPLAGDLLCELDSSELREEYKEQVIKLKQAEADLVKAEANRTIQRSQNRSDEAAAHLAQTVAELELKKYLGESEARRELERFLENEKLRNPDLVVEEVLAEFSGDDRSLAARYGPDFEPVSDVSEDEQPDDEAAAKKEGEFAQQRNELLGAVTVAEEDLARTREVFEFTKRLARKGYKSLNDVEADRIAVTKARIALSVAREKLGLLDEFSKSRTAEEMLANFVESVAAKERTETSGTAALKAFEKEYEARVNALEIEQSKHDRLTQQLEACLMFAPSDGIVVYANQQSRRSSDNVVIEERATVRERQAIIKLPDLNRMQVDAQVHESRISLLDENGRGGSFASLDADGDGSLGPTEMPDWTWNALVHADVNDDGRVDLDEYRFPVSLRIDSYPGERFLGLVQSISSVPSPSDWMRPNLKQYAAEIEIVDTGGRSLKPGMTTVVEVLVKHRANALQVPVQAVVGVGSKRYCWVLDGGATELREVRVGDSSTTGVEIVDGVVEGETVVMNPRTHFAKVIEELRGKNAGGGAKGRGAKKPSGGPGSPGA